MEKKVKDARNPATIKYQDVCEKVYGSMQEDIDTWKSGKFDKLEESLKLHKEDLQAFYGVYKELKHRLKNETKDNTNFLVFPTLTEFVQVCMDANPTPVESGNCDTKIKYNAQLIRQRTRLRMCFALVLIAFMMCLFFWPIDGFYETTEDWSDPPTKEESDHDDTRCGETVVENGFQKTYICEKVAAKQVLEAANNCYQHRTTFAHMKCGWQALWQKFRRDRQTHVEIELNALVDRMKQDAKKVVNTVTQQVNQVGKYVLISVRWLNAKVKPNEDVSSLVTLFFFGMMCCVYYLLFSLASIPKVE